MKLESKQIKKIIAGFIYVPQLTLISGTTSKVVTSSIISALTTGGFNGTSVPDIKSTSETNAGVIVGGSLNENIVIIDTVTGGKIINIDKTIFGKITWDGNNYLLSFYYLNTLGNLISYTLPTSYNVTLKIPYRFEFDQLPTDVIIKLKQWWLNGDGGGQTGGSSTWETNIAAIKVLTNYTNGSDIGCYENQSIYEFNSISLEVPDDDFVLKPDNILLTSPGRWLKRISIEKEYYSNQLPSTVSNFEGVPIGTTFDNKTMKEMWDMLLYPYQYPSFNSFSLSDYNTLEVGQSIPIGNKTFTWLVNNSNNLNVNSISISGPGFATVNNLTNDSAEIINFTSPVTLTTPGTQTWAIAGVNSKDQQFSKTYSVTWKWSVYYGESSLDVLTTSSDIINLRASILSTSLLGSISYISAAQKYKYFCFPADWTNPTGVRRADNGLTIPGNILPDLVSVVKNGVTKQYKVWRSYEKLEGEQTVIIY